MKTTQQKLNNVVGQINAIKRMIENNEDCLQTAVQFRAAIGALRRIMSDHIKDKAADCLPGQAHKKDKDLLLKLIKELDR